MNINLFAFILLQTNNAYLTIKRLIQNTNYKSQRLQ